MKKLAERVSGLKRICGRASIGSGWPSPRIRSRLSRRAKALLTFKADAAGLLQRLQDRPGVRQATIFGQSIHALVDTERSPADLGLSPDQIHQTEPSLEDVFVALSRAAARKEEE